MIIDIHTHFFPDDLAARAIPALSKKADSPAYTEGTLSSLKDSMIRCGVAKSVLLPIATKPSQTRPVNEWAVSVKDESIIPFGSLHPEYENWKEQVDFLHANNIKGIKLHPDYQDFYVDDQKLFTMYEYIFLKNMIILFHAGVDIGLPYPIHCTPKRLLKVMEAFPQGTIIAAHMGGFKCWDDVFKYLAGRNVYFDTSYTFEYLDKKLIKKLILCHGVEKILFGTDSPWSDQSKDIKDIYSLNLGTEEENLIFYKNAARLLGLLNISS